jgi:hypothetical protein
MKKILLLGIVFMTFSFSQAQVFSIGGLDVGYVYVGPKVGFGSSFISNLAQDEQKTRILLNLQGGIVGKFGITDKLSIQPELILQRKGGKVKQEETQFSSEADYKTIASYIGLPILAKYSFLKWNDLKFHASGGFYTNISVSQEAKYEYTDESYEEILESDTYKSVDFGLSVGGGIEYDIDYGILVGELLVEHGFVDTYENDFIENSNRHTTISVGLTFLLDIVDLIK